MLTPSSFFIRLLYCLCLLSAGMALYKGLYNLVLLLGAPGIWGILNVMVAVLPNVTTAVLCLVVVGRLFGVVIGKFKLNTVAKSGPIWWLRIMAIWLMALSVLPWFIAMFGVLISRGADGVGFVFLVATLGGSSPWGLLLFEISRLLEREILIEGELQS